MNFSFDLSALQRVADRVAQVPERARRTMATALTRTAIKVRDAEVAEMRDSFDRPTRFTLNALYVSPAQADGAINTLITGADGAQQLQRIGTRDIEARVGIKDDTGGQRSAIDWLRWQIRGGLRTPKAFERLLMSAGAMPDDRRAVPGRFAKLDAFGNMSRGQIVQILSQLRIDSSSGSTRSLPRLSFDDRKVDRNRKLVVIRRARQRAGGEYVAFPNGRGKLRPGIYLFDRFNREAMPVLLFVSKAEYEPRFDFQGTARYAIQRHLGPEVAIALAQTAGVINSRQAATY